MSKKQNIFVRSLHELKSTRCIAVTALLIAINITLDLLGLTIKLPPNLRIGFGFLCNAAIGMLFGPVVGMMAGVCTDVLGYFAGNLSMGAYFPGYTLTAVVGGLIWGRGCIRVRSPSGAPSAQRPASTCSATSA